MGLREYRKKRDFARTPEPAGAAAQAARDGRLFVVQKHRARRLHYDFRLELDGVLKSWAVPKGPSLDPHERRLAVHVEDHPIEYGDFEGVIPQGEYGGGTVMLWDCGTWEPIGDAAAGYKKGHLKFRLDGEKLHGGWALVRIRGRRDGQREDADNWLLIKERDEAAAADGGDGIVEAAPLSVATHRDLDAIARERRRVWRSGTGEEPQPEPPAPADPESLPGARRGAMPELAPQLAGLAKEAPAGEQWLHEIKYDGYRVLARKQHGRVVLQTRNGLDWTRKFPEIAAAVAQLPATDIVLDGEVVHGDGSGSTSFSKLQEALSAGDTAALGYFAFDLLYHDGWDLTGAPLEARKRALAGLLGPAAEAPARLHYSDHQLGRGPEFLAAACRMGLEGIVSKRRDQPYRSGRGGGWVKTKCTGRQELVIVGFTDPAGSRQGFGALLVGYPDRDGRFVYAGKVGTGYSTETLHALRRRLDALKASEATVALPRGVSKRGIHWVRPELVGEFGFTEWTSDRILRHPRFLGLREDKKAGDVVREEPDPPAAPAPAPPARGRRQAAAQVGGVSITNPDKLLYPQAQVSKGAVAEYYAAVADWMLPYIVRRPLSLLRCPDGVGGECFFQKHLAAGVPAGVLPVAIEEKGATRTYRMIEDAKGLLGLVQLGVLEFHPWGATVEHLEQPDILIFDLDPDEGLAWERVVAAAVTLRGLLRQLGLESFAKVTGGKGLHVVVPIRPALEWDAAKAFSKAVAARMAEQEPRLYTLSPIKTARRGRLFLDYLRNGRGATAVAAYSTRARAAATVAMPVTWQEVEDGIAPDRFTIANAPAWLRSRRDDPWAALPAARQSIAAAVRRRLGL